MTELKDGIKNVVDAFFEEWECPSNQVYSEYLAQRIADSLVVDEEKLTKVAGEFEYSSARDIITVVINAKPIKCEVGEC